MSRFKKFAIIFLLTVFFLFDDVLIYLLLKNMFQWKVNPLIFGLGATVVIALNFSLALVVFNIMRKRPTTGQQGMIGKIGVVLKKINGEGQIQINGEIWKAESFESIRVGEKVVVEKVEGLRLIVKRLISN